MRARAVMGSIVFCVCAVEAAVAWALVVLNLETPTPRGMAFGPKGLELVFPLAGLAFAAVGALIIAQRPGNRIGWLYVAFGLSAETLILLEQYGLYAVVTEPGRLWAGHVVLWIASWSWVVPGLLLPLLLAFYPDGRLPGPRWRFIVWCAGLGALAQATGDASQPRLELGTVTLPNPIWPELSSELGIPLYYAGSLVWSVAYLGAAAALIARYRRARRVSRQQIKWFVYGSIASALLLTVGTFSGAFSEETEFADLLSGASALSILLIPLATAIAIFRSRLYDIDLLIKRTVVYGATSAAIAVTFFGGIVALQAVLRPITSGSELAVAASTLVSFALFHPIRGRVQDAVDRRFDRSRYDAARTLDAFADGLRDEVDLEALHADLLGTVSRTMSPAHASLWLREAPP